MKYKYKCKENDNRLKLIVEDGKLDEMWVGTADKLDPFIVIGFNDLRDAFSTIGYYVNCIKKLKK